MTSADEEEADAKWNSLRARFADDFAALDYAVRTSGLTRLIESRSARRALRKLEDEVPSKLREVLKASIASLKTRRAKPQEVRKWETLFAFLYQSNHKRLSSVRRLTRKQFVTRERGRRKVDTASARRSLEKLPFPKKIIEDVSRLEAKDKRSAALRRSIKQMAEEEANQAIRGAGYDGLPLRWDRVRKHWLSKSDDSTEPVVSLSLAGALGRAKKSD